jgi:hypothetical protein
VLSFVDLDVTGPLTYIDPETGTYVIPLEDLFDTNEKTRSPSTYALAEIGPAVDEQQQLLGRVEQGMNAQAAFAMLTGDFDSSPMRRGRCSSGIWRVPDLGCTACTPNRGVVGPTVLAACVSC